MASLEEVTEAPLVIDAGESIAKAMGLMKENEAYGVIVTSDGEYLGVVDDRCLLRYEGDVEKTKCSSLARKAKTLAEDSAPEEAVADFINSETTILPVVRGARVVGSVTRKSALKLLAGAKAIEGKSVADVMTSPAITMGEEGSIEQAVSLMRGKRVFRVVVVDDSGRLAGVVSSYDLAMKLTAYTKLSFADKSFTTTQPSEVADGPVSTIMTTSVVTIGEDAPLREAVSKMIGNNLRALVVARAGKPIGVVSAKNVFEACLVGKPLNVFVHGLSADEKMLKDSIVDEGAEFLERLGKHIRLTVDDSLEIHVKSSREGFKKRFEVRSKMTVGGKVFTTREPDIDEHRNNWDAHMAVSESLGELQTVVTRDAGKTKTVKKAARSIRKDIRRGGEQEE